VPKKSIYHELYTTFFTKKAIEVFTFHNGVVKIILQMRSKMLSFQNSYIFQKFKIFQKIEIFRKLIIFENNLIS